MRFTFPTRDTFNTLSSQPGETVNFRDPESVKRFPWLKFIIIGGGIPILFTFIGGFFIYQDFTRTRTWDNAPAIVTRAELLSYRDTDGDLLYRPLVEFEYTRAGKMYTGDIGNQGG
ncbi:hypothetical protein HY629_00545, partial [Candidatus Uhrbacteria bacterium]|nr:hypothetical protein [Candidatus Uhrbacteria bacterium]